MNVNNTPPVLVPQEHWPELEKISKAALMDMVWSLAGRVAGEEGQELGTIREEWAVIKHYRK